MAEQHAPQPSDMQRAASTYSLAALDQRRAAARAKYAHCTTMSAMITLSTPLPRIASNISATRMAGKDSWMSTMRISSASMRPPK